MGWWFILCTKRNKNINMIAIALEPQNFFLDSKPLNLINHEFRAE